MERTIRVTATAVLREHYRALLKADWRKWTLGDVLELLWQSINTAEQLAELPLQAVLNPDRRALPLSGFDMEVINEFRSFRRHFRNGEIPPVPKHLPSRGGRRLAQAETTWCYLILGTLGRLRGETGFFADCQSLLFLLALDFLLPELEAPVRACLVNARRE